jgi:hypothetical protein
LVLEKDRIRFYSGTAALPEADELIKRLEDTVDAVTERAEQEAARAREEAARADALERRLAAALAELEKRNR